MRELSVKKPIKQEEIKKFDISEHNITPEYWRPVFGVPKITIPNHNLIKSETLNSIINNLSENLKLGKNEIYKMLF